MPQKPTWQDVCTLSLRYMICAGTYIIGILSQTEIPKAANKGNAKDLNLHAFSELKNKRKMGENKLCVWLSWDPYKRYMCPFKILSVCVDTLPCMLLDGTFFSDLCNWIFILLIGVVGIHLKRCDLLYLSGPLRSILPPPLLYQL